MKTLAAVVAISLVLVLSLALVIAAATARSDDQPSDTALAEHPPDLLRAYMAAAPTCPGLPWEVLAAIGWTESRHAQGRADPATGDVHPPIVGPALDGTNGVARIPTRANPRVGPAHGNMQFLKTTWPRWGRVAPGRAATDPDYDNAWDSIYAAAAYLCGDADRIDDLHGRAALQPLSRVRAAGAQQSRSIPPRAHTRRRRHACAARRRLHPAARPQHLRRPPRLPHQTPPRLPRHRHPRAVGHQRLRRRPRTPRLRQRRLRHRHRDRRRRRLPLDLLPRPNPPRPRRPTRRRWRTDHALRQHRQLDRPPPPLRHPKPPRRRPRPQPLLQAWYQGRPADPAQTTSSGCFY